MLRHGWLSTGIASFGLTLLAPNGADIYGWHHPLSASGVGLASADPPVPTPVDPAELEELRWRFIIKLLCAIIPCRSTDPDCETTQSATECLHARLDRFESEGLLENLSQSTVEEWIGNVDELIDILSGPNWQTFVTDHQERIHLLDQLAMLRAALEGLLVGRGDGGS